MPAINVGRLSPDARDTVAARMPTAVSGPQDVPAAAGEIFDSALGLMRREGTSISDQLAVEPHLEERNTAIQELTGLQSDFIDQTRFADPATVAKINTFIDKGEIVQQSDGRIQAGSPLARSWLIDNPEIARTQLAIRQARTMDPQRVLTDEQIMERVSTDLAEKRTQDEAVLSRARGAAGVAAMFGGTAVGALNDPLLLGTLPLGFGPMVGKGIALNAGRAFLAEAGIAAAVEIPIQADVLHFKRQINSPYSVKEAAFNVLAATLGAGVLRATGSITIDVAEQAVKGYRARVNAGKVAPTEESEQAAEVLEQFVETAREAPAEGREQEHFEAITKADADIEAGRPVNVEPLVTDEGITAPQHIPGKRIFKSEDLETFDPRALEIDAETFQFKSGADEAGLTRSFQDIDQFNIEQAGLVIVYENKGGRQFIVDGHQRMGIARRALDAGQDPESVRLFGVVLRETDGVTPAEARATAAFKNIAESTGSGLDAAKVFRELGEEGLAYMPQLPRAGVIASRGRMLARLDDEGFRMVVNEIVPEDQAAIVGELVTETKLQRAALDALAKTEPANQVQAREVVKQVREAGAETRETGDLFGGEITESLILERAKVVDDALRELRSQKRTFNTLVEREEAITGTGANQLDRGANQQQVTDNAKIADTLQREAHRKGPISELVQEAARRLKDGDKRATVRKDFLRDLQGQADGGDGAGGRAGGPGEEAPNLTPTPGNPVRLFDLDRATKSQVESDLARNQIDWSLDEIYTHAPANQARFIDAGNRIADELGIKFKQPPGADGGIKVRAAAQERMVGKGYEKPGQMTDIVRGGFIAESPELAARAIDRLAAEFDLLDEGLAIKPAGYADHKAKVRMPDGQIAELQIWSDAIANAKFKKGTALYTEQRTLGQKTPDGGFEIIPGKEARFNELNQAQLELYMTALGASDAWARAAAGVLDDDMFQVLAGKSGISDELKKVRKSSLESKEALPDESISAGLTGVQSDAPGLSTKPAKPPSERLTTTAGRPSKSANVETESSGNAIQATSTKSVPENNAISQQIKAADLFDDAEAERAFQEAQQILNDQGDVLVPTEAVVRDGEQVLVERSARELFDEIDQSEKSLNDLITCHRGAA